MRRVSKGMARDSKVIPLPFKARRGIVKPYRYPVSCGGEFTSLELCAGAGGQAIALERAGFTHIALVEMDRHACSTLRENSERHNLQWNVLEEDLRHFSGAPYTNRVDLLAGGLPCPPFSRAGKQLGEDDDRNLWPTALRIIDEIRPKAVMFENVRGILDGVFAEFRQKFQHARELADYHTAWELLNASDFGVPQLRPRVVFIAIRKDVASDWSWNDRRLTDPQTVGEALYDLMAESGWIGAKRWAERADFIAPTIVGGSHKHGGPDLGPVRARNEWRSLDVDGGGIADLPPGRRFAGSPKLTLRMVARLQGFPDTWKFSGGKTAAYRQIGNAFPPPAAEAVATRIAELLRASSRSSITEAR